MRVVIAERLTRAVRERYTGLIASADACWAFRAPDWQVARDALNDRRWRIGDYPLFDPVEEELGRWAYGLADLQRATGPLTPIERVMIAYGLQVRLRGAARAHAILNRIRTDADLLSRALHVDVIASDPYLRAAFGSHRGFDSGLEVHLHPDPNRSASLASLRERAVASRWLRSAELALASLVKRRQPIRQTRSLAFFVGDRAYLDLFAPIRGELMTRGWQVTVFEYDHVAPLERDVIEFSDAVRVARISFSGLPRRRWSLGSDALRGAPISAGGTLRALDASWMTAHVQIERHRRVLKAWQPDVVVSYGPDTMSLALQGAARECGIPSVFLPHGFLAPIPTNWSLPATATAVLGWGCVDDNSINPLGERQDGLVVVGHPNYDELVRRRASGRPTDLSALGIPPSRPFIVLLFVEWGLDLLDHAVHQRTLAMTAKALPGNAFVICKLHPGHDERARSEDVLDEILDRDSFRVVSSRDYPMSTLLQICHVAVAQEDSMALADAIVAGVPAIGIRHPEQPLGSFGLNYSAKDYREVCSLVADIGELREAMISLTRDAAARARLTERRSSYIKKFLFAADGRSSARAADLIEHLAAGKPPETFMARSGGDFSS